MSVERNIKLMEWITIIRNGAFLLPVIVLYYRDEIGLSFQDFLISEAFFAATVLFFEVPSGWLSDMWKRKFVMVMACVTWTAGLVVMLLADNLYWAIAAQMTYGVAYTLFSGTDSSILYDSLLAVKRQDEFAKLEGRRKGLGFYFLAFCSIIGAFLYEINHDYPLIFSIGIFSLGIILSLMLVEPDRHKSAMLGNPIKDMLATMRYAMHGHTEVAMIVFAAAALFATTKLIMWIQQPYYAAQNIPESWYGVLVAGGYFLGGLASHINHLIKGHFGNIGALRGVWILAIFICIVAASYVGYAGIALLMFGGTFIYGLALPKVNDAINQRVGSERRATIMSTASFLREVVFIPLSIAVGWATTQYSVSHGLYAIVGWLSFSGLGLFFFVHRMNKNGQKQISDND